VAKVFNNIFIRGLTGSLGEQFVIRKTRSGQTIIANKPTFDANRVFNEEQLAHQEAFRQATIYAKAAKDQPIYVNKAQGTAQTAYNVAVADWFRHPQVIEIDARSWNGGIGQLIHIKAIDDMQVKRVTVTIRDESLTLLEEGEAVQSPTDGLIWTYTTQTAISFASAPQITATAEDLPGHKNTLTWRGEGG
jgi:hypothetical protein